MSNLSSPRKIKAILERHGFAFSKSLGQNFIIDDKICPKMAELSGIDENFCVIEVGPGIGVLTYELSKRAKKVIAIELDKRLIPVLEETLADCGNVKVINADVLKIDLDRLIEDEFGGKDVFVCANLPYYITSPVIMRFLESGLPINSMTFMVQKEAAERICAVPGTRECGAVSISVRYHCEPEILFNVKRRCFTPVPNVDSAVIRLNMLQKPPVEVKDKKLFFKISRAAFSQRRKKAINSISSTLSLPKADVENAFTLAGINENARAEELSLQNFADIANFINHN